MPESVHGFKRADILSNRDHVFSAWLRAHKAAADFSLTHRHNSVTWYAPDKQAVAIAFYDNAACKYVVWIREDLNV